MRLAFGASSSSVVNMTPLADPGICRTSTMTAIVTHCPACRCREPQHRQPHDRGHLVPVRQPGPRAADVLGPQQERRANLEVTRHYVRQAQQAVGRNTRAPRQGGGLQRTDGEERDVAPLEIPEALHPGGALRR